MIYNRRKRAEYFAEQKALLRSAQEAEQLGAPLTPAQLDVLAQEAAADAAIKAAKGISTSTDSPDTIEKRPGVLTRSRDWLFSGLKKDDAATEGADSDKTFADEVSSQFQKPNGGQGSEILRAVDEKKKAIGTEAQSLFEDEKQRQRTGGLLDRLGTDSAPVASAAAAMSGKEPTKSGNSGWFSYLTGR